MKRLSQLASNLYRRFHGRPPLRIRNVTFTIPQNFVYLGQAIAIVYKCNKLNGGGDGTFAEYEHEFETPVMLYADETGKKQLFLLGKDLKVTSAGIEN